ncbi:IucA/IucC family protein [Brevibacillus dissolubilis]|uniref:IucA/IucC family protein n=1 Tax=Brevibacillus dissolubilis TaxID=1844116 RepID=UPI00159BDDA7|nr:IucA/IucC family protein [Brevibacillus dissolubilis]
MQVRKEEADQEEAYKNQDHGKPGRAAEAQEHAEQAVLYDLINAMLHENLLGILQKGEVSATWKYGSSHVPYPLEANESYFYLPLDRGRTLMFRVCEQPFIQSYKISRPPAVLLTVQADGGLVRAEECDTVAFMKLWAESVTEEEREGLLPNLSDFLAELSESIQHHALSWQALQEYQYSADGAMLDAEQFSAFRDRPFHPTSRAKRGWDDREYRLYSSEFGHSFGLDWVAVRRDYIQASTSEEAYTFGVLDVREQELLREAALQAVGADLESYTLLPVHPWQMEHVLPEVFRQEMEGRIIVPVIRDLGDVRATSSVRALAVSAEGHQHQHVKVPVGIYSLGALRIMPPRYLHNGAEGQHLLARIMEQDAFLQDGLRLCQETKWWAFDDPNADPFADKPGHLACLIREYPRELLEDTGTDVITMSALAVLDRDGKNPMVESWIHERFGGETAKAKGLTPSPAHILQLFAELSQMFLQTTLRCFRYGIMPEVHGQNVMLTVRGGNIQGILLRDHDTIRLHLPWLEREGIAAPNYTVKPGTPNSLINDTPEKLLSYLQTLGLQVNLYAIVDAWSKAYGIDEALFWQEIQKGIETCLSAIDFPAEVHAVVKEQLLLSPTWPTRLLIGPLLKRRGSGGGSMPADAGVTQNPLQNLKQNLGVGYADESVVTTS